MVVVLMQNSSVTDPQGDDFVAFAAGSSLAEERASKFLPALSHSGIAVRRIGLGELAPQFARRGALRPGWTAHLPLRRAGRQCLAPNPSSWR